MRSGEVKKQHSDEARGDAPLSEATRERGRYCGGDDNDRRSRLKGQKPLIANGPLYAAADSSMLALAASQVSSASASALENSARRRPSSAALPGLPGKP